MRQDSLRTIALWGAAGSGKGGLLGALFSEASRRVGERWMTDVADAPPDAAELLRSASLALRVRDLRQSPVRRPERSVSLTLKRFDGPRETDAVRLVVSDPRGPQAGAPMNDAASRETLRALVEADGVIWLIAARSPGERSPGADDGDVARQVAALLELAGGASLEVPVAVCLSKVDRLPASEMRRVVDAPETGLRERLGDEAFAMMAETFPQMRCFAISGAGLVRNTARPLGLTNVLDWFASIWREADHRRHSSETRLRVSAQFAKLSRWRVAVPSRAVVRAAGGAGAVAVLLGGAALGGFLPRPSRTWNASAGELAVTAQGTPVAIRTDPPRRGAADAQVATAVDAYRRGDARRALQILRTVQAPTDSPARAAADSLLADVALRVTADALNSPSPNSEVLRAVVTSTSGAIQRASPGSSTLAPLSLARAGACIGGGLGCSPTQVREDLAWVLLLGTAEQQDEARRLRGAWTGDSARSGP